MEGTDDHIFCKNWNISMKLNRIFQSVNWNLPVKFDWIWQRNELKARHRSLGWFKPSLSHRRYRWLFLLQKLKYLYETLADINYSFSTHSFEHAENEEFSSRSNYCTWKWRILPLEWDLLMAMMWFDRRRWIVAGMSISTLIGISALDILENVDSVTVGRCQHFDLNVLLWSWRKRWIQFSFG